MAHQSFSEPKVKEPNVAGQFYTDNPTQLSSQIEQFINAAKVQPLDKHVDVLIAPHAGYIYSGSVAAHGFKAASNNTYSTVVILAPSHFFPFKGISIWQEGFFKTPLGDVEVDSQFTSSLIDANENFYFKEEVFDREHALEVEIPFLQETFEDFKIVPIIMGQPSMDVLKEFALALKNIIGNREDVLIVVSTDMSHYHEDQFARTMDARTIEAIKDLKAEQIFVECHKRTMEMCGFIPVTAAILYAKAKGLNHVEILKYAHSGDVSGDMERVVGYTSALIYKNGSKESKKKEEEGSSFTLDQKKKLVQLARETVEEFVRNKKKLDVNVDDPRLLGKEEGIFVTIYKNGQLRGCMGSILGNAPMCMMVRDLSINSASRDPRFKPVEESELESIDIEVSVLSKPRKIDSVDEIIEGVHGVIVSQGSKAGVFLPQVWDHGYKKDEFLSILCSQKAGLSKDCWKDPKTRIEIYTAEVFGEKDFD